MAQRGRTFLEETEFVSAVARRQAPFWFWQKPASWSKRIFFLGRPRKKTLCKRKKTHKGNPRVSLENPFPTEGPRPLRHPWGSRLAVQYQSSVPTNIQALSFFI